MPVFLLFALSNGKLGFKIEKAMKILTFFALFLLCFSIAEAKTSSHKRAKSRTFVQEKKSSQNETPTDEDSESRTQFDVPRELKSEIKQLQDSSDVPEQKKPSKNNFSLEAFKKIFSFLKQEPVDSKKYKKEVHSLETSFYNGASLESLITLSVLFDAKNDTANHIKVLDIIVANYPDQAKSHYLFGLGYKKMYLKAEKKDPRSKSRQKAIDGFSQAIKLDRAYEEAYKELLPLLAENGHNSHSLDLIKDMIRYFAEPGNYSQLCSAYYETHFVKQSRKACAKATEEDPDEPTNYLFLAFVQEKTKDIKVEVEKVSGRFLKSFDVQFKTGEFFTKTHPSLAIKHFTRAIALDENSYEAHRNLAWLLFKNENISESYDHFLKSCIISLGKTLKDFQKAAAALRYKKHTSAMSNKWQKGLDKCFQHLTKNKKKKPPIY